MYAAIADSSNDVISAIFSHDVSKTCAPDNPSLHRMPAAPMSSRSPTTRLMAVYILLPTLWHLEWMAQATTTGKPYAG